jgi:hypothetical protein
MNHAAGFLRGGSCLAWSFFHVRQFALYIFRRPILHPVPYVPILSVHTISIINISAVVQSIETATKHGGVAGAVLPCAAEARTRTGGRSTETSSRHIDTRGTAIAINMQSCL